MQIEETRFVYFDISNKLLREICKEFKVKVEISDYHDILSENHIGYEGRSGYCYVHKSIPNYMGTPGDLGLARWFADMILYTKIGNKKATDFIRMHADEIDRYTSWYEIEYEHCDPESSESCLLIETFNYQKGNVAKRCGFDESGWEAVWQARDLAHMETYMPEKHRYPLQSFAPKPEEEGHALGSLLNDGFGDRNGRSADAFLRNVAKNTLIAEFSRTEYLSRKPIPYSPAPQLSSLEDASFFLYGKFAAIKANELKSLISVNGGKCSASYSPKTNIVLVSDSVGECIDHAEYSSAMGQMEIALARKWLNAEVVFVRESDFLANNAWIYGQPDNKSKEQAYQWDADGNLVMTSNRAATIWSVKMEKKGVVLSGYTGSDEILYIPAFVDGIPVIKINKGKKNTTVIKIVIPATVQTIAKGAFPQYKQLEEIEFRSDDTIAEPGAFTGCPAMCDQNGCLIVRGVLHDCPQTGDVVISGTVKEVPDEFLSGGYSGKNKITSITIEEGVEKIGRAVFEYQCGLQKITIPATVDCIEFCAFNGCTGEIAFHHNPQMLDNRAFGFTRQPDKKCRCIAPAGGAIEAACKRYFVDFITKD